MRTILRIRNFDDFMAHATRDFDQSRCPQGNNYVITPQVFAALRGLTPELQQAISDTGVLGAVRNINNVLMARLCVVTQAMDERQRLG
eukprot:4223544-Heterocapsa_arctica.AAC.1